jgi:hypothetical protein
MPEHVHGLWIIDGQMQIADGKQTGHTDSFFLLEFDYTTNIDLWQVNKGNAFYNAQCSTRNAQ